MLELEHPAAYLLAQLTHLTALPVHRAEVERYGNGFARAGRMVGNGPFVLKSYTPNDRLVLTRNPYFHDAADRGRSMVRSSCRWRIARRRCGAFLAGEIDSYDDVPADQIAFVRARLPAEFKVAPSLGSYFYAFDTRHKPFDDPRVRRALAMVIDRDFLATTIWGGTMLPSYTIVPPDIPRLWAAFERDLEGREPVPARGRGEGADARGRLRPRTIRCT